ncbi:MAG: hypothetical protein IJ043_09890 [Clostridia bacterium]|nr:hypothetical protein [Clostridia bacterium]
MAIPQTRASKKKKAIFLPCMFEKMKRIAFIKGNTGAQCFPRRKTQLVPRSAKRRPDTLDRENPFAKSEKIFSLFIKSHGNDLLFWESSSHRLLYRDFTIFQPFLAIL